MKLILSLVLAGAIAGPASADECWIPETVAPSPADYSDSQAVFIGDQELFRSGSVCDIASDEGGNVRGTCPDAGETLAEETFEIRREEAARVQWGLAPPMLYRRYIRGALRVYPYSEDTFLSFYDADCDIEIAGECMVLSLDCEESSFGTTVWSFSNKEVAGLLLEETRVAARLNLDGMQSHLSLSDIRTNDMNGDFDLTFYTHEQELWSAFAKADAASFTLGRRVIELPTQGVDRAKILRVVEVCSKK